MIREEVSRVIEGVEGADARRRSAAGSDVQLHFAGAAGAAGTSAASDSRDRGCGAEGDVAGVCAAVRGERAAVDRAGEAAAGATPAIAVHGEQRSSADGPVGLLPVGP